MASKLNWDFLLQYVKMYLFVSNTNIIVFPDTKWPETDGFHSLPFDSIRAVCDKQHGTPAVVERYERIH